MNKLDSGKLYVTFFPGATLTHPVNSRYYTLTHSDQTGDLFLSIGLKYQYNQITKNRDEVLARWNNCKIGPTLYVYIHVDSDPVKTFSDSLRRFNIFKQELPLALGAIRFGDQALFTLYPFLDCVPILISFESIYPALCKIEYWGTFSNYR